MGGSENDPIGGTTMVKANVENAGVAKMEKFGMATTTPADSNTVACEPCLPNTIAYEPRLPTTDRPTKPTPDRSVQIQIRTCFERPFYRQHFGKA